MFHQPLKPEVSDLGNSLIMGTSRFISVERRLQIDEYSREAYVAFMEEYEKLGHMHVVTNEAALLSRSFYLSHHPILKASSLTTKFRVVFDASAISSTGISLNDILMFGPTVQEEFFSILIRFRTSLRFNCRRRENVSPGSGVKRETRCAAHSMACKSKRYFAIIHTCYNNVWIYISFLHGHAMFCFISRS